MGVLSPGQMLDGTSYQVVRELGAGGMGVVYEIEHVRLKKRYVAKVIHDQIRNDDGAAKRMEREAQVLAAISHPNIVQVHDVGTTQDGVSYFVMEKLEGIDLRSTMKRGVTWLRSIEIVSDVLDALEYVHRRGIVHRDIKPENIFLSEQPRGTVTKVLDFGIVHIFDKDGRVSQGRITKTGGFVGTLYYAAPEQMQGKPASPPNDVYAAGLVLFELLAGKGPFDDDPGVGLSRCFKPAPLLSELVPQAPRELSDAVAKALEQDPERRPSAGALALELRAVASALKSIPAVAEDEAIRAEVHDLLRHMAPIDDAPPRPAAGRMVTPARDAPAALASTAGVDIATGATAVPATPVMAGAPGAGPSHPRVEPTLASATGEPPPGTGAHVPNTAAYVGALPVEPPVPPADGEVLEHPPSPGPTLLGAGHAPIRESTPIAPARGIASGAPAFAANMPGPAGVATPGVGAPVAGAAPMGGAGGGAPVITGPAHGDVPIAGAAWPAQVADAFGTPAAGAGAHARPSAPGRLHGPSPETERGIGPAHAGSGHVHPSQPGQPPPVVAATTPVRPVHASTPGAPARHGDTSPGVYATVDKQPTSTPLPKRVPWAAVLTIAAGAVVLVGILVGGALALRQKTDPVPAGVPSAESIETPAEAPQSAESSGTATPPTTSVASAHATTPTAAAPVETAADPGNRAVPPSAATPTTAALGTTASSRPMAAGHGHVPPSAPTGRATTTNIPGAKAPGAPRAASSGRAAEKDGYINTF